MTCKQAKRDCTFAVAVLHSQGLPTHLLSQASQQQAKQAAVHAVDLSEGLHLEANSLAVTAALVGRLEIVLFLFHAVGGMPLPVAGAGTHGGSRPFHGLA